MASSFHGIPDSEFYMWRAVFAFAFTDNVLSLEEQDVLKSYVHNVEFSELQMATIRQDFKRTADVISLHRRITQPEDKQRFCILARALVWCEGDMDRQEAEILKRVSCMKDDKDYMSALHSSREHALDFYQNYAKASVAGLFKAPPNVEMRV